MKSNEGKKKFSLVLRMVLMALIPLVLIAIVLVTTSVYEMGVGMGDEVITGLEGTAYAVSAAYGHMNDDDWRMEGDNLYKGDVKVTEDTDLLDSFVANSDVDITIFYGDTRRATTIVDDKGERIVGTPAGDAVIEAVLKEGGVYSSRDIVINNKPYYASYIPMKNADGEVVGMFFAGQPSKDVENFIIKRITILVIITVVFLIIAIFVVIFEARHINKAVVETTKIVKAVSSGDLSVHIGKNQLKRTDELGEMARGISQLLERLREVVEDIQKSAGILIDSGNEISGMTAQTSASADEISLAVEDISKGAVSQAEDVDSAASYVTNVGDMIAAITERVEDLNTTVNNMKKTGDDSNAIIKDLGIANDRTTEAITRIGKQIHATNESAQKIREAVNMITTIATETNLLSLNASIEAARAGEQGKGFAVVASEIQKLAEQSNESAHSIELVIDALIKESEMTVSVMDEVEQIAAQMQEKLTDTKRDFQKLDTDINHTYEGMADIKSSTETCSGARNEVADVMSSLSAISEQNAAATQQTTASMQELNATMNLLAENAEKLKSLSDSLKEDIGFFKL